MGVAVFDLDNTIIRGSSLYHFGVHLLRQRQLNLRDVAKFSLAEGRFALLRTESPDLRQRIVTSSLRLACGQRQSALLALCRAHAPSILRRYGVADVLAELHHHQAAGRRTILITATPVELALAIGVELGFSDVIGTRAEVSGDVYTGVLSGPVMHGQAKRSALEALLNGDELVSSYAYSDSMSDLPLLTAVRYPVAVNPDRRLKAVAVERRWRLLETGRSSRRSRASRRLVESLPVRPLPQ